MRWLHDPLMPSTAPGGTCLSGARRFERRRDWQASGIQESDGCGAVMRVVPLALAFRGEDLLEAARISALLTHAHPNALEAAMAGAWLVGQVLETGHWGGDLVEEAIRGLEGPWGQGGTVAEGLRAALVWAGQGEDWLDEGMIPPGTAAGAQAAPWGWRWRRPCAGPTTWGSRWRRRRASGGLGLGGLPHRGPAGCGPGGGGDPAGVA